MNAPTPGQLWLVLLPGATRSVAAIRSREQDSWTVLGDDRQLVCVTVVVPLRPIPGESVPLASSWDERVALLAGFVRPELEIAR